ncbi:Frataxin-like domain-containing protein [Xylariales sp. PMI_506]|nr:Frataxin-like domain-containing protein [Xylariales sp. PMI_506]
MTRTVFTKLPRAATQVMAARRFASHFSVARSLRQPQAASMLRRFPGAACRAFTTSSRLSMPLPPDVLKTATPADVTDAEYHELADEYIDELLTKYEHLQDEKGEIDVEYSAGVMTIKFQFGDYVINKQPPNKQIWLSSPISGPKRFDWVVVSEDQSSKQDTATGGWVYLRDGTFLSELLYKETGVDLEVNAESD